MTEQDAVRIGRGDPVPVLDLARWEVASLERVGSLLLRGHSTPSRLLDDLVVSARRFFALPLEDEMQVHRVRGGDPGYDPPAASRLAQSLGVSSPPDLKEGFGVAPLVAPDYDHHPGAEADRWFPPNRWPEAPVRLTPLLRAWFTTMSDLSDRLLRVTAVGLELPETWFEQHTRRHTSTGAALHCPPQTVPPEPGQLRAGAHTDHGTLTLLHKAGDARGLQVRFPERGWTDVVPPPGCFVVNLPVALGQPGDVSLPFFHEPVHDAVVRPLGGPAAAAGRAAGRHLADKVDRMHAATA